MVRDTNEFANLDNGLMAVNWQGANAVEPVEIISPMAWGMTSVKYHLRITPAYPVRPELTTIVELAYE